VQRIIENLMLKCLDPLTVSEPPRFDAVTGHRFSDDKALHGVSILHHNLRHYHRKSCK